MIYQVDLVARVKRYWIFHVNCIRAWKSPSAAVFLAEEWEETGEEEERANLNTIMPKSHLIELERFKSKYRDVLQDIPGKTSLVSHSIPTGDSSSVRLPRYRLAHKSQEVLREEIKTLLSQGIIKPSTSLWATPIVLVAKKNGSKWMCVYYWKLNAVTVKDPYPWPNIVQLIANLGASKYIPTLDLTKGYH